MVLPAPIDWTAIYSALYDWANGATGITTRWADQDVPRPDFPYVLLDIIATGKEGGIDEVRTKTNLSRVRDVKVTPIARNLTTYRVTINGTAFDFASDASATVPEITAGLKAAIDAGSEPVTVTDNSSDIDIVGDGEALNPTVPQTFTLTVGDDAGTDPQIEWANNDAGSEIEITATGQREFTLNVQAFERNTRTDNPASDPGRNAYNYLTILQSSLGLPSVQAALRAVDVALIAELPITDLSEQVEDTLLSRASMDVRMRTVSVLTETAGYIDKVSGEYELDACGETVTGEYEADAEEDLHVPFR